MSPVVEDIRQALNVLVEPRSADELRAFKGRLIKAGYLDDHDALAEEAAELDRHERRDDDLAAEGAEDRGEHAK